MASVGGVYLNFGLWAVSLIPAWLVVSKIGVSLNGEETHKERVGSPLSDDLSAKGKV